MVNPRFAKVSSSSDATNYTVVAANRLTATTGTGASTYPNDADGNTLSGGGRTNTWDSQNRLVSCIINGNTSTYRYGADGLRRQSTKNGVSTDSAYNGTMLVREGHASGGSLTPATETATYLIGARGPEYRRDDTQTQVDGQGHTFNGKARWYVFDGLGSVVGEVDPSGNLTSSPKYDVYGATRSNSGVASSKQGFVGSLGHVSDDNGLVYMQARYYDPSTGRFVSEDSSHDGNNWYQYCGANPINFVDADGKTMRQIAAVVIAALLFLKYFGLDLLLFAKAIVAINAIISAAATAMSEAREIALLASALRLLPGYGPELAYGLTCAAVGFAAAAGVVAICAIQAVVLWAALAACDKEAEGSGGYLDY